MNVHLYDVTDGDDFLAACRVIKSKSIESRVQVIGGYSMKMESELFDEKACLYCMDFTKHRSMGPGRATKTTPTQGFNLGADEDYGELTAILYDSEAKVLLVEYNHHGCRAGKIAEYIRVAGEKEFEIEVRLNKMALAKLETKKYANKVSYRLKLPARNMTTADQQHGMSLTAALDLSQKTKIAGVGEVEITLFKARGKTKRMESFKGLIKNILKLHTQDEDESLVRSIKANLSETLDDTPETIDFLKAREEKKYNKLKIDSNTRMYPFDIRCTALKEIHNSWVNEGIIVRNNQQ